MEPRDQTKIRSYGCLRGKCEELLQVNADLKQGHAIKDVTLNALLQANAAQAQALAAKDLEIAAKDQMIAAKDVEIATKDQSLMDKDQTIAAKDQALAAKDAELLAKDNEIANKDQVIKAQSAGLSLKDMSIANKDREITDMTASIAKKDFDLGNQMQLINTQSQSIVDQHALLSARNTRIGELRLKVLHFEGTATRLIQYIRRKDGPNRGTLEAFLMAAKGYGKNDRTICPRVRAIVEPLYTNFYWSWEGLERHRLVNKEQPRLQPPRRNP